MAVCGLPAVFTLALALGACLPGEHQVQAQTSDWKADLPPADPRPGVTTHFSQGWPSRLNQSARELGTATIRDSLHWAAIETVPGQFTFTDRNSGHVARACAAGMTVLLGIDPRNKLYDGGASAYTPAAQQAFARYLGAIAARYRSCVVAVEIGNEINGRANVTGPAASNRAAWYIALLKAVRAELRPAHPDVAIIGGSTNTIAVGFLDRLFAAGMLDLVDGVAVHPYRPDPEGTDLELDRLGSAMARHGPVKPVWATEFSRDFAAPGDAAGFYLKMKAQLEAAGTARHFWYALIDQTWFPTMGLLTPDGIRKPAADAYAFAASALAPAGPAVRVDHGDPALYHYRFGKGFDVIWGAPRALTVTGADRWLRADGSPRAPAAQVSDEPVVIEGAQSVTFGPAEVLADSFHDFAGTRLTWLTRKVLTGAEQQMVPVNGQYTTYLGLPGLRALSVTPRGLGPIAGTAVVLRYVATSAEPVHVFVCLAPQGSAGDGVTAEVRHNGAAIWTKAVGPLTGEQTGRASFAVRPGDRIELIVAPGKSATGDRMHYRFQITRAPGSGTSC